ncbi:hypothetical protein [Fuerstiella marisgermanici]|nr:hypothetical protein [Fuerstiella marisgermanici]
MALRSTPEMFEKLRMAAEISEYWFEVMPFREGHRQALNSEFDLSEFLKNHNDYRPAGPDDWGYGAPDGRLEPPTGNELPAREWTKKQHQNAPVASFGRDCQGLSFGAARRSRMSSFRTFAKEKTMARFLFQCVAIVGIFFATLSGHSFADAETASLTDTFHKHPVIVHRKGHTPYLTVDAKLVSVGQTGMLVYLVEPTKGPSRYDWVPLSQIEHFSAYASIEDAISGYNVSDDVKSRARERFQARWSTKTDITTPIKKGE